MNIKNLSRIKDASNTFWRRHWSIN